MNKFQLFIKENLLSKSFSDPENPIREGRLTNTLILQPTDGSNIKRRKNKKVTLMDETVHYNEKQINYSRLNKNSKQVLKEYIDKSRKTVNKAKKIINEKNLQSKSDLQKYLSTKNKEDILESLPCYENCKPMYEELWCHYIREVLDIPENLQDSKNLKINGTNALLKLSMADYNGCLITVSKSRNQNMVGIKGIILWDSQKTFIIISKGQIVDEIKCIPKKGTVFSFEIPLNSEEALQYTILGDRFKYRSVDRAGRKFKSRRCDDLLYYIS